LTQIRSSRKDHKRFFNRETHETRETEKFLTQLCQGCGPASRNDRNEFLTGWLIESITVCFGLLILKLLSSSAFVALLLCCSILRVRVPILFILFILSEAFFAAARIFEISFTSGSWRLI